MLSQHFIGHRIFCLACTGRNRTLCTQPALRSSAPCNITCVVWAGAVWFDQLFRKCCKATRLGAEGLCKTRAGSADSRTARQCVALEKGIHAVHWNLEEARAGAIVRSCVSDAGRGDLGEGGDDGLRCRGDSWEMAGRRLAAMWLPMKARKLQIGWTGAHITMRG